MEQGQHPDVDEGIKAFREKRAACWQPYR
jgi:hypothetical protein